VVEMIFGVEVGAQTVDIARCWERTARWLFDGMLGFNFEGENRTLRTAFFLKCNCQAVVFVDSFHCSHPNKVHSDIQTTGLVPAILHREPSRSLRTFFFANCPDRQDKPLFPLSQAASF
jgi:hypothetical protein